MHAYHILLPSETDDSRFNSREKHMLTDSVQPYNKPIIDLACSVCTVKYQTSDFCMALPPSSILKKLSLIFHSTDRTSEVNNPLLFLRHIILCHHVVTPIINLVAVAKLTMGFLLFLKSLAIKQASTTRLWRAM